ncbi:MAG TPA: DnaB-like helicase N-terminal domain-containing protein [Terracidiphilus sp.]|jgi:hypothetical protein
MAEPNIRDWLESQAIGNIMLLDEKFDSSFMGYLYFPGQSHVALYDAAGCLSTLIQDGLNDSEAGSLFMALQACDVPGSPRFLFRPGGAEVRSIRAAHREGPPDTDEILLGEVLNGTKDFATVAAQFSAEDFQRPEHRRIFTRMAELHGRGEPINRIFVANELMKYNELEACGGLSYLCGLGDFEEVTNG